MTIYQNATLYLLGGFGALRVECKSLTIEVKPYHPDRGEITQVTYIERGKRKETKRGYREPEMLVLKGFDHPEHDAMIPSADGRGDVTKFASFDKRWKPDFEQQFRVYVAANQIQVLEIHGLNLESEVIVKTSPKVELIAGDRAADKHTRVLLDGKEVFESQDCYEAIAVANGLKARYE